MRAKFLNEIEFNFEEPPYKRYVSNRGIRGPKVENPRKGGYGQGLTPEEKDIKRGHEERLGEVSDEVEDFGQQIDRQKDELYNLQMGAGFDESELEQFYADVQNDYGFDALDILNSGASDKEKIQRMDALSPSGDKGLRDIKNLIRDYNYYHPDDPDPSTIEDLKADIKKLGRQMKERQNTVKKLEDKIYNIENY